MKNLSNITKVILLIVTILVLILVTIYLLIPNHSSTKINDKINELKTENKLIDKDIEAIYKQKIIIQYQIDSMNQIINQYHINTQKLNEKNEIQLNKIKHLNADDAVKYFMLWSNN